MADSQKRRWPGLDDDLRVYRIILSLSLHKLALVTVTSALSVLIYRHFAMTSHDTLVQGDFPLLAAGTIGTALAMLTAFRFNMCYSRWVESHTVWDEMMFHVMRDVNNLALLLSANGVPVPAIRRHIKTLHDYLVGFLYAMNFILTSYHRPDRQRVSGIRVSKGELSREELEGIRMYIPKDKWPQIEANTHVAFVILTMTKGYLAKIRENRPDHLDDAQLRHLFEYIDFYADSIRRCEKIAIYKLPKRYDYMFDGLIMIFCFLLPWCLVSSIGWLTVPVTVVNFLVFYIIDALAKRTEVPFGRRRGDVDAGHIIESVQKTCDVTLSGILGPSEQPRMSSDHPENIERMERMRSISEIPPAMY